MDLDLMHWHEAFRVGIHVIDEQHRRLFELVNRLALAGQSLEDAGTLDEVFAGVVEYAKVHFQAEEHLFRDWPVYESHRAEHLKFVRDLEILSTGAGIAPRERARMLHDHLAAWLRNHILRTDITTFNQAGFRPRETSDALRERLSLLGFKPSILLVEDSPTQRRVLKTWLEGAGFAVIEASSGRKALRIVEETRDLRFVITDLDMPDGGGFDLIRNIRKLRHGSVYIMVVTGIEGQPALLKSFELGANDYLRKPVSGDELLLRVRNGMNLIRIESQEELIFAMAKLSDYRSPETGQHLERVQLYSRLLGVELARASTDLALDETTALEISRFTPLHDIGKVAIPDAILNKPGSLTPQEFEVMKDHARIGGDLLDRIMTRTGSRSLSLAYALTMHHHEKWNGTGYPSGLAGEEIPVAARITALADVYDALTSARSYKEALSREEARQVVLASSGLHFDPRTVEAFRILEPQFHAIREELADDSAKGAATLDEEARP